MVKVTFRNRDGILAAIVRALAGQVAGAGVVAGMSASYLRVHGFYRFSFTSDQAERFRDLVKDYVPESFQSAIEIIEET